MLSCAANHSASHFEHYTATSPHPTGTVASFNNSVEQREISALLRMPVGQCSPPDAGGSERIEELQDRTAQRDW